MRCIKRNIGHLCHDEPREGDSHKKTKSTTSSSVPGPSTIDESEPQSEPQSEMGHNNSIDQTANTMRPPSFDGSGLSAGPSQQAAESAFNARALGRAANPLQLVQPTPGPDIQGNALSGDMNECRSRNPPSDVLTAQQLRLRFHSLYFPGRLVSPKPLSRHAQLPPQLYDCARGDERVQSFE